MGKFVLNNAAILFDNFDLSGESNEVTLNLTKGEIDVTVFGDNAIRRTGGLKSLDASWSGFFEANAAGTGSDNIMFGRLGQAAKVLTIIPEGATAGNPCYFTRVTEFEYSTGGTVGDAMSFTGAAMSSEGDPIVRGTVLGATSYTNDTNGAAFQLGTVQSFQTLYGAVHATAYTGLDSVDVILQSDDDPGFASSPATRLTFTTISAIAGEWQSDGSTVAVDTQWRVVVDVTGTGSITLYTVAGIINDITYPQKTT